MNRLTISFVAYADLTCTIGQSIEEFLSRPLIVPNRAVALVLVQPTQVDTGVDVLREMYARYATAVYAHGRICLVGHDQSVDHAALVQHIEEFQDDAPRAIFDLCKWFFPETPAGEIFQRAIALKQKEVR